MAKAPKQIVVKHERIPKKTSQDIKHPKTSSMNKRKRATFKPYRGQGRP